MLRTVMEMSPGYRRRTRHDLLILAAWAFFGASGSFGETYRQWLAQAPRASAVQFLPWVSPEIRFTDGGIPKSPPHNLFGHVDLSKLPVDRFPVTVSFFCDLPDKLFSGNREVSMEPSKFRWGQRHGFVSADRALGLLRLTRRVEVAAVERDRLLPVAGLSAFGLNLEWLSLRCEVCDHTGQILAREWPVEICRIENRGQAEWESCRDVIWTGDVNVRNYLYRRGFTPFHAEPSLPAETSAYEYIGAVSASDAAIRDSGLTQAFWRRLLLMGTVVAGTPEVCDEISRRIGLAAGSGVLNAALLRSDQELWTCRVMGIVRDDPIVHARATTSLWLRPN
ncbi:MAG: hypothetical protein HZA91_14305 [Verrucomicrobia bacterium]|nr:hypothetical protein [Verrucomicrobiota bacterium]